MDIPPAPAQARIVEFLHRAGTLTADDCRTLHIAWQNTGQRVADLTRIRGAEERAAAQIKGLGLQAELEALQSDTDEALAQSLGRLSASSSTFLSHAARNAAHSAAFAILLGPERLSATDYAILWGRWRPIMAAG